MIIKFHKIKIQDELGYPRKVHDRYSGCMKCAKATKGLIGQVPELALPYSVHEQGGQK